MSTTLSWTVESLAQNKAGQNGVLSMSYNDERAELLKQKYIFSEELADLMTVPTRPVQSI